ncbi:hypothetical protein B0H16DRAFT_1470666 [Mycena metata]|uniref:Uncharacterized protein n=1 Tax=Mycena metata TaxID=1033252 RepID=A0AAD7HVH4_9AGAR|nr:hypothetical protein B0H16DRAFT_1470666 [Mycena metata]
MADAKSVPPALKGRTMRVRRGHCLYGGLPGSSNKADAAEMTSLDVETCTGTEYDVHAVEIPDWGFPPSLKIPCNNISDAAITYNIFGRGIYSRTRQTTFLNIVILDTRRCSPMMNRKADAAVFENMAGKQLSTQIFADVTSALLPPSPLPLSPITSTGVSKLSMVLQLRREWQLNVFTVFNFSMILYPKFVCNDQASTV